MLKKIELESSKTLNDVRDFLDARTCQAEGANLNLFPLDFQAGIQGTRNSSPRDFVEALLQQQAVQQS